ncbi:MAG TPA: site-specific integrase [Streptosporangiaceae bacterium]|nr:site-specific integrase [Streptosporangiaceae bacterium]
MTFGQCARCGRPVGIPGRQHCARCHYALAHRPVKQECPGCGKHKALDEATGRCVLCSRACARCGHRVGRKGRVLCRTCRAKDRRAAAQRPCPRCGKPGRIRAATGWCGHCSHPGRPPAPDAACGGCGTVTHLAGAGLCPRCYDRSPHRITVRAAGLAASLDDPPAWLPGFAEYLAPRHHAARACQMITVLSRLLRDGGPSHPRALPERAAAISVPLARALDDFFTRHGLALPHGHEEHAAAGRRQRRLQAIPPPLRAAAEAFTEHELSGRQRALRAGTRPRQHATIESHLTTIRDLAAFLTATTAITDWATVTAADIEAFLATQPSRAAHRLSGLRRFFSFAARRRLILVSPVAGITISQPWGFRGPALSRQQQRSLFRRWTSSHDDVHPHEAATGLLALVHGATTQEIRLLTVAGIDPARQAVHLPGRPHPTPLDPWTWAAIQRCLGHRQALGTDNPHLLVTRVTKATCVPANAHYVKNTVAAAGVRPRILRSSRLLDMVNTADPKLVAEAFGMTRDAVTAYLADRVDPTRLDL